jgi:hypothetical protein
MDSKNTAQSPSATFSLINLQKYVGVTIGEEKFKQHHLLQYFTNFKNVQVHFCIWLFYSNKELRSLLHIIIIE